MPISPIVLQRRHAELGRIRLGAKKDGRGRPMKLETFRFTSPSETYVRDLAELYGGTPQPWDNNGVASWEVFTTATQIPVIAVKGGLSQWMETWSGGGCSHRCDGERGADGDLCNPQDPGHINARPTTRLSVMLPELDAIGVWRMESHGWNAAAEIPAVAELAQFVGDLVPAQLHLVERRAVKDGKTSRFVVPVLDLRIGQARLREIVAQKSGAGVELAAPTSSGAAAIEAPRPDYAAIADTLLDVDSVRDLWQTASVAGHLDDALKAHLSARVETIKADAPAAVSSAPVEAPTVAPVPDAEGVYEAQVVEDAPVPSPIVEGDPDQIWSDILKAGAGFGWGLDQVVAEFRTQMNVIPDEASAAELATFLQRITTGEAGAA